MNSCPTCEQGFAIYVSSTDKSWRPSRSRIIGCINQHINDNSLEKYHYSDIPYLFFDVAESSLEILQQWLELFGPIGLPKENVYLGKHYSWHVSKENFIYLLDNGFDPNVFFPDGEDLWCLYVKKTGLYEILELMINRGYIISSNSKHKEKICSSLLAVTMDYFDKTLDILDFTAEDGKKFIDKHLESSLTSEGFFLEEISHISKKYDLRDYVKSHPSIKYVLEFVEKLDQ